MVAADWRTIHVIFHVSIHVTLQEKVCFQILLTGAIPWQQWVADMATQMRITVPLPSSSSTVPVLLPEPNTTISFIVQQQANMMASIDRLNQTLQAQAMQPHFFLLCLHHMWLTSLSWHRLSLRNRRLIWTTWSS